MISNNLVEHNGSLRFVFGRSSDHLRIEGRWVSEANVNNPSEQSGLLFNLLRALPNWPLVDGINMNKSSNGFIPDAHQFLPMDMLESGWLAGFGVHGGQGLPRSRILIADEGGTGKTLSASLAVRYASLISPMDGPIVCLVPPLLIYHWVNHLKQVFNDEPERVVGLNSASHFGEHHHNRIVVVSKWSWAFHFQKIKSSLTAPVCVVVDEVHQGRTGQINDVKGDEEYAGMAGQEEDSKSYTTEMAKKDSDNLRTVVRETCCNAAFVIGVSATPINLDLSELNTILTDLGEVGFEEDELYKKVKGYTSELGALTLKAKEMDTPISRKVFFQPILDKFPTTIWENHKLSKEDISSIISWCSSEELIHGSEALRSLRELHPYGKSLSIVLRNYLSDQNISNFRKRNTVLLPVESGEMEYVWENVKERTDDPDGVQVLPSDLESLRKSALILHSHRTNLWRRNPESSSPYYKGDFPQGQHYRHIKQIEDPRLSKLIQRFSEEMDEVDAQGHGDIREHKIGCVLFTEWNGTIDGDGLMVDIKHIAETHHHGKHFRIFTLRGGQGVRDMKATMQQCHRLSLIKGFFPILITSPAGEVGVEMAWASNLVHWDMHTNPQRMEQRTWRVDRRIEEGGKIGAYYNVFFPMFENNPLNQLLERKIQPRWETACNELGKPVTEYLSDSLQEVTGINKTIQVLGKEISKFKDFVLQGDEKNENYHTIKHRWKALVALSTLGFEFDNESEVALLTEGKFTIQWPQDKTTLFDDENSRLVRDIELISLGLSDNLAMRFDDPDAVNFSAPMSRLQSKDRSMPLFDKLLSKLSGDVGGSTYSYKGTEIEAIALSTEIMNLHENEHVDETGIMIHVDGQWKIWSQFTDEQRDVYGIQLLEIVNQVWKSEVVSTASEPEVLPSPQHPSINDRIQFLQQFCTEQQIKIDIHQKVIDSDDLDEEKDDWRRDASKTCSSLKEIAAGRILTLSEVLQRCTYRVYMNRSW
jgi:hypothetical protein